MGGGSELYKHIQFSLAFLIVFLISYEFSIANCDFTGNNPAGGQNFVCDTDPPNPDTIAVVTGDNNDNVTVLTGAGIDAPDDAIATMGGDDTIIINGGNTPQDVVIGSSNAIDSGAGNDDVTVNGGFLEGFNDTIRTQSGDDRVVVSGATLTSLSFNSIHTEAGMDEVVVNNSILTSSNFNAIETDDGDDYVEFNGGIINCGGDCIKTEDGDDLIMVNTFGSLPATIISTGENAIDSGMGNDQVTVIGATLQGNPNDGIFTTSGDDTVIVEDAIISSVNFHPINTSSGNDNVILRGGELIALSPSGLSIRLGSEDDTVSIERQTSLTGLMDGEDGIDTLIFALDFSSLSECEAVKVQIPSLTGDDSITIDGFNYSWINFEVFEDRIICPGQKIIPTLSQWGLIAMAGVLGIAALLIIRRSRAAA